MVAGEEDDDADGDAVRPGLLILSAQMRTTFSQQLDTGRGLGCTMATVLVIGGDGYVRSRSRKGLEGEGGLVAAAMANGGDGCARGS